MAEQKPKPKPINNSAVTPKTNPNFNRDGHTVAHGVVVHKPATIDTKPAPPPHKK